MRDVYNWQAASPTIYRDVTGITSYGTFVRWSYSSQRSDPLATTRLPNGEYGIPTPYRAFFGVSRAKPGTTSSRRWMYVGGGNFGYRSTTFEWEGGVDNNWLWMGTDVNRDPAVPQFVVARARQGAINKIKANDWNAGETLGELRESVGFITSKLVQAAKLALAFRRVLKSRGHNLSAAYVGQLTPRQVKVNFAGGRDVAQAYLAYVYGVRPLMSDIYAVCDRIQNGLGEGVPVGNVKSVALEALANPYPAGLGLLHDISDWDVRGGCETSYTFCVNNASYYQLWRYGVTNPGAIAWELTNLSFVVDWFTGLGNFLSGLQRPLGLKVLSGYETLFLRASFTVRRDIWRYLQWDVGGHVDYQGQRWAECPIVSKGMLRYPLGAVSTPPVYFRVDLNLNQGLSAIALLVARSGP